MTSIPPREIPGYYYDPDKKKYFKIQASNTAPATAPYSPENVKRRKVQDQEAQEVALCLARRQRHIQRSKLLESPLPGGFLVRECGYPRSSILERILPSNLNKTVLDLNKLQSARERTSTVNFFVDRRPDRGPSAIDLYMSGDTGVRVTEFNADEFSDQHSTDRHPSSPQFRQTWNLTGHSWAIIRGRDSITSMSVHEGTRHLAISYISGNPSTGIGIMKMASVGDEDISVATVLGLVFGPGFSRAEGEVDVFSSAPAPPSSSSLFAFGTSHGILQVDKRNFGMSWLASHSGTGLKESYPPDVFALEYLTTQPSILLSGGRNGIIDITDCRSPEWGSESSRLRHPSAVARIKQLDDHRIIVAGLNSTLQQYDLRYRARRLQRTGGKTRECTRPVLEYPEYRNISTTQTGFDVDIENGIVAAGQDFGQVALFSLHGGHRLTALPLENSNRGRVSCVRFAMDNDRETRSLWVGHDPFIERFAW
ncbi:hypothetical protein F5884DRAFT_826862 [Xylogone sp. PMI_703]|nr:hypothetical protein F5884DRAFT_826862 [Xylogone sp. PMI_703]